MHQGCYIEDEGRPLGTGWQKLVSNRCVRHQLRSVVVSDTLKVSNKNWQVTVQETTEKEPSMRCRKRKVDVKTRFQSLIWDKSERSSVYCSGGIRHRGGVTCTEAFMWNMGTCRLDVKEKLKQRTCKSESTEARHRGGPAGSSGEVTVMVMERSGWLIEQVVLSNFGTNGKSINRGRT